MFAHIFTPFWIFLRVYILAHYYGLAIYKIIITIEQILIAWLYRLAFNYTLHAIQTDFPLFLLPLNESLSTLRVVNIAKVSVDQFVHYFFACLGTWAYNYISIFLQLIWNSIHDSDYIADIDFENVKCDLALQIANNWLPVFPTQQSIYNFLLQNYLAELFFLELLKKSVYLLQNRHIEELFWNFLKML